MTFFLSMERVRKSELLIGSQPTRGLVALRVQPSDQLATRALVMLFKSICIYSLGVELELNPRGATH